MKETASGRMRSQFNNASMRILSEKLSDAVARIEQVIWLPSAIGAGEVAGEPLRDLLSHDDEFLQRCFGPLPNWLLEDLTGRDGDQAFAIWLESEKKTGFVIEISTPMMNGTAFNWSAYHSTWVYGDTLIAAVIAGLQWVEDCRIKEQGLSRSDDIAEVGPVFLDVETTGLSAEDGDEVLEIALIDAAGTVLMHSLVRPTRKTEWPEAMAVHGITPDMVRHAPTLMELGEEIRMHLQDREVVAYNMAYDLSFVWPELDGALVVGKTIFPHCALRRFADVIGVWDQKRGDYKRWKLQHAAEHVGHQWSGDAHRALADAQACRSVWLWLEGGI